MRHLVPVVWSLLALVDNRLQQRQSILPPRVWLVKTTESFKIADLQALEAKLQAEQLGTFECRRVLLDQATGSSLLALEAKDEKSSNILSHPSLLPSSLQRCEWMGSVHVNQTLPDKFLKVAERQATNLVDGPWTMRYHLMTQPRENKKDLATSYTSRSLLLCTAQRIPLTLPAALDPSSATNQLMILDAGYLGLFLIRLLSTSTPRKEKKSRHLQQCWASRPFKYSSAMNFVVAEIVIDLLQSLLTPLKDDEDRRPVLLDPTCGSGSFLGVALDRGFNVVGWDINPKCVSGTKDNLRHLLGEGHSNRYQVETRDSTIQLAKVDGKQIDCVVSNLPWGLNSIQYVNDTRKIVASVRQLLHPGVPCAFIAKQDLTIIPEMGFKVLGKASIPPINFALPSGKQKSDAATDESDVTRKQRNACVVIIARTI